MQQPAEAGEHEERHQGVALPQIQFVQIELRHRECRDRREHPRAPAAVGQQAQAQGDQACNHADRQVEPDRLRGGQTNDRQWRHEQRERGQVLVLKVSVFLAVEGFGGKGAGAGPVIHLEVRHLPHDARSRHGGQDGQDHDCQPEGARRERRAHLVTIMRAACRGLRTPGPGPGRVQSREPRAQSPEPYLSSGFTYPDGSTLCMSGRTLR